MSGGMLKRLVILFLFEVSFIFAVMSGGGPAKANLISDGVTYHFRDHLRNGNSDRNEIETKTTLLSHLTEFEKFPPQRDERKRWKLEPNSTRNERFQSHYDTRLTTLPDAKKIFTSRRVSIRDLVLRKPEPPRPQSRTFVVLVGAIAAVELFVTKIIWAGIAALLFVALKIVSFGTVLLIG